MTEAPIKATLKSGTGYDAPWVTVDGASPAELQTRLRAIIDSGVLETVAEAAGVFRATQLTGQPTPAPQAPPQQPAAAPWPSQPPQQQQQGPRQHPEGKQCSMCGSVLAYKEVNRKSDGKQFKFWACPNQRNRDDGHQTEFAN